MMGLLFFLIYIPVKNVVCAAVTYWIIFCMFSSLSACFTQEVRIWILAFSCINQVPV